MHISKCACVCACSHMCACACTCMHLSVWCRAENGLLSWFISLPWFLSFYLLALPPFLPRLCCFFTLHPHVSLVHCLAQSSSPGQQAHPLPWLLCMVPADDTHSDSLYRELSSDRGRHLSLAVVMLTHEERDVCHLF